MHMDELKSQKVWLCWNYETRKGKRTKVPISASGTATGTNSEYAHTWVTYDEAIKAADKHGYNGVGCRKSNITRSSTATAQARRKRPCSFPTMRIRCGKATKCICRRLFRSITGYVR